jgi:hypothetical protein
MNPTGWMVARIEPIRASTIRMGFRPGGKIAPEWKSPGWDVNRN